MFSRGTERERHVIAHVSTQHRQPHNLTNTGSCIANAGLVKAMMKD